jgi:hypothetical protein
MHLRGWLFIGLACAMAAASARAQTDTLRIIGIVEVPRLFNLHDAEGQPLEPESDLRILLRARPAVDAPIAATITEPEALGSREYGYEVSGALVYGRERGWSLVKTTEDAAGWLAPGDSGAFHSLEALLEGGLTYLTDDWDGFISASPGGVDRMRVPGDPDRAAVGYITPVLPRVTVVLEPGQDVEEVRRQYRSLSMGSRPGPNGTRVFDVETGVVLPLFEAPDVLRRSGTHIETNRAGETLQTTHQSPAQVLVFDTRPGWFQVALNQNGDTGPAQRAWLQASALWRFHPVKDEAEGKELADRAWGPEDWSVRVVGFQTVGDTLWANVEVMSESECRATDPPTVRARGWIPAHAPSGAPNIWFYSRGC